MAFFQYSYGRLLYRKKSTGAERGREDWQFTRNRDGSRTLRCLAMTDDSRFVRDVTYTLGTDSQPQEVFIRLQVAERHIGSGLFQSDGKKLHVTTQGADTGRVQQELLLPVPLHIMTHAVMLDGWTFWSHGGQVGEEQMLTVYNTSTRWNGIDGPLGRFEPLRVLFVGEEEIQVPAGRFRTRHFRVDSDLIDSPPSDLWVTPDDLLLVKYDWNSFDLEYVLASLHHEG